jgi:hypothetical protein
VGADQQIWFIMGAPSLFNENEWRELCHLVATDYDYYKEKDENNKDRSQHLLLPSALARNNEGLALLISAPVGKRLWDCRESLSTQTKLSLFFQAAEAVRSYAPLKSTRLSPLQLHPLDIQLYDVGLATPSLRLSPVKAGVRSSPCRFLPPRGAGAEDYVSALAEFLFAMVAGDSGKVTCLAGPGQEAMGRALRPDPKITLADLVKAMEESLLLLPPPMPPAPPEPPRRAAPAEVPLVPSWLPPEPWTSEKPPVKAQSASAPAAEKRSFGDRFDLFSVKFGCPSLYTKMCAGEPLEMTDIIQLCDAKVAESVIIKYIREHRGSHRISQDEIYAMRQTPIPNNIIDLLLSGDVKSKH